MVLRDDVRIGSFFVLRGGCDGLCVFRELFAVGISRTLFLVVACPCTGVYTSTRVTPSTGRPSTRTETGVEPRSQQKIPGETTYRSHLRVTGVRVLSAQGPSTPSTFVE